MEEKDRKKHIQLELNHCLSTGKEGRKKNEMKHLHSTGKKGKKVK